MKFWNWRPLAKFDWIYATLISWWPSHYQMSEIQKMIKRKLICNRIPPHWKIFQNPISKLGCQFPFTRVFFRLFFAKAKIRFRGESHFLAERNDLATLFSPKSVSSFGMRRSSKSRRCTFSSQFCKIARKMHAHIYICIESAEFKRV